MNDKYAKEIAKELKLIRVELQKVNKPVSIEMDAKKVATALANDLRERTISQSDD